MMKLLPFVAAFLLWTGPAHAQFANRSLGLFGGYMDLDGAGALDVGIPIGFRGTLYIESGFDAVAHFGVMIARDEVLRRYVVGITPALGIRYLFSEESLRPYLGVDLSYLAVFRELGSVHHVGLGPNVGLDVFLGDSVSLGVRGVFNVFIALNQPTQLSGGAHLVAATYF
jgi:outer membrane protein